MKSENGRSMVEMLGVLAIIGVLSVGAIAGYSKAMMKYKLNNLSQGLSQLIQNYVTLLPQLQNDKTTLHNFLAIAQKLNLLPSGISYDGAWGHSQFGKFEFRQLEPNGDFLLVMRLDGSQLMEEYCRQTLVTMQPWSEHIGSWYVRRTGDGMQDNYTGYPKKLNTVSLNDFQYVCSKSCNADYDYCTIDVWFYFNEIY
jgi:hypothetical protein